MKSSTKYTPELAEKICARIADGLSLDKIAKLPGMPSKPTILKWAVEIEEFDKLYSLAKEAQIEGRMDRVDALNEEMVAAARDEDTKRVNSVVNAYQNRIQNEFRMAACLRRRKYGDKVDLNHSGAVGVTLLNDIPRPSRD